MTKALIFGVAFFGALVGFIAFLAYATSGHFEEAAVAACAWLGLGVLACIVHTMRVDERSIYG